MIMKKVLFFLLSSSLLAAGGEEEMRLTIAAAQAFGLSPHLSIKYADGSSQLRTTVNNAYSSLGNFFSRANEAYQAALPGGVIRAIIGAGALAGSLAAQKLLNRTMRDHFRKKKSIRNIYLGKKVVDIVQMISQILLFGGLSHSGYHQWHDKEWRKRFYNQDGTCKNQKEAKEVFTYENFRKTQAEGGLNWQELYKKNKKIGAVGAHLRIAPWLLAASLHVALLVTERKRMRHEKMLVDRYDNLPEQAELKALLHKPHLASTEKKAYQVYFEYLKKETALRWVIGLLQAVGSVGIGVGARFLHLPPLRPCFDGQPLFRIDGPQPSRYPMWDQNGFFCRHAPDKVKRWWAPLVGK